MTKINLGLFLLILSIALIFSCLITINNDNKAIKEQLELINAKLNDLDDDIHDIMK